MRAAKIGRLGATTTSSFSRDHSPVRAHDRPLRRDRKPLTRTAANLDFGPLTLAVGSGNALGRFDCLLVDFALITETPAIRSFVSSRGRSAQFPPESLMRAPFELGWSPERPSKTPTFISSVIVPPVAVRNSRPASCPPLRHEPLGGSPNWFDLRPGARNCSDRLNPRPTISRTRGG